MGEEGRGHRVRVSGFEKWRMGPQSYCLLAVTLMRLNILEALLCLTHVETDHDKTDSGRPKKPAPTPTESEIICLERVSTTVLNSSHFPAIRSDIFDGTEPRKAGVALGK